MMFNNGVFGGSCFHYSHSSILGTTEGLSRVIGTGLQIGKRREC
jgi:hypothetical protein